MLARRAVLVAAALLALVGGLLAGLVRLGWLPHAGGSLGAMHGPLMVMGFLGTLIPLERAVALDRPWGYLSPALSALGGVALLAGLPQAVGGTLLAAGATLLVAVFVALRRREPSAHMTVLTVASVVLALADAAWLLGWPVSQVAWAWIVFLVLTITGERLELARVRRPPAWSQRLLLVLVAGLVAALGLRSLLPGPGMVALGAGLLFIAGWLLRFDVALRTVRGTGLPRFVAACLLAGYAWLGLGGLLAAFGGPQAAGPLYDAQLHAILVGFVFSMILGHAPVILPAILRVAVPYRAAAWLPLVALHLSLSLRVGGDLFTWPAARSWGGLLNVVALVTFAAVTAGSALADRLGRPAGYRDLARRRPT